MCWSSKVEAKCDICESLSCPLSLLDFLSKLYYFLLDVNYKVEYFPVILTWLVMFATINFFFKFVLGKHGPCSYKPVLQCHNICPAVSGTARLTIPFIFHYIIWRPYYFFLKFIFDEVYQLDCATTLTNVIVLGSSVLLCLFSLNRNKNIRANFVTKRWRKFCYEQYAICCNTNQPCAVSGVVGPQCNNPTTHLLCRSDPCRSPKCLKCKVVGRCKSSACNPSDQYSSKCKKCKIYCTCHSKACYIEQSCRPDKCKCKIICRCKPNLGDPCGPQECKKCKIYCRCQSQPYYIDQACRLPKCKCKISCRCKPSLCDPRDQPYCSTCQIWCTCVPVPCYVDQSCRPPGCRCVVVCRCKVRPLQTTICSPQFSTNCRCKIYCTCKRKACFINQDCRPPQCACLVDCKCPGESTVCLSSPLTFNYCSCRASRSACTCVTTTNLTRQCGTDEGSSDDSCSSPTPVRYMLRTRTC